MAFQPGKSGNPGGRPKGVKTVQEMARDNTTLAMSTLMDICRNTKAAAAARVSAAEAILDRGWGKVRQSIDLNHSFDPNSLSDAELASIAAGSSHAAAEAQADADESAGLRH